MLNTASGNPFGVIPPWAHRPRRGSLHVVSRSQDFRNDRSFFPGCLGSGHPDAPFNSLTPFPRNLRWLNRRPLAPIRPGAGAGGFSAVAGRSAGDPTPGRGNGFGLLLPGARRDPTWPMSPRDHLAHGRGGNLHILRQRGGLMLRVPREDARLPSGGAGPGLRSCSREELALAVERAAGLLLALWSSRSPVLNRPELPCSWGCVDQRAQVLRSGVAGGTLPSLAPRQSEAPVDQA
jgi:hypothetical protein